MVRVLRKEDWFHADGFPISIERRDPQEPFGLHAHDFSELVIITGGRGLHVTGRESWPLVAGDVFVIGPSRPHDYRNMADLRLINLLFEPRVLEKQTWDLPALPGYHALFNLEPAWRSRHQFRSRLHLQAPELARAVALVDMIDEELQRRDPGFAALAAASFMQLIGYLARCYSRSRDPDTRSILRIAEAITHLESHYRHPINLDELASIAHMSKRTFMRAFGRATGATPIAYLIQLRIRHAAALLRREPLNISEVAFRVGFDDSNYFSRQFRQIMGTSPREYRRAMVSA